MNPPMTDDEPPMPWSETRALIRSDFDRLMELAGEGRSFARRVFWFLLPAFQGLMLYRISRHLHLAGWRNCANLVYLFSMWTTRIDIPPRTRIGPACRLGHPPIILCGRIGSRFTTMGFGGMGGGFDSTDIGAGPGLPVVGDDVTFAIKAAVLGPVRIGDGARIGPNATVTRDVPAGALVAAPLPKVVGPQASAGDVGPPRGAAASRKVAVATATIADAAAGATSTAHGRIAEAS